METRKSSLSEEDIKHRYITPAIERVWPVEDIRMEVPLTAGRVNIKGNMETREPAKFADYVLYTPAGQPLAIVEAKANRRAVSYGMQQAKTYAEMLDIRFAYISNGDAFAEYDFKTGSERELPLAHKTSKTASSSAPGSLLDVIGGTSYKKNQITTNGLRILRGGNINTPDISLYDDDVFLPLSFSDAEKLIRKGDILIVASTGSKKVIGKPAFVYKEYDNISIGAFLRICRLFYTKIFPYITLIFSSEYYRNHIRKSVQGTNINNMKKEYILDFLIPLPPLAEQHRMVARLEDLLPLCDALAAQL